MTAKARILFVDDEKRVLNSMRGLFRREFELFLTTEGVDAIRIAAENDLDVVVSDQRMPGMSGIEVLGKVKELSPRTVRILLTGYADPSAVEGSINIGEVFRFLSKPCPPKTLRETLQKAIEAARATPDALIKAAARAPVNTPPQTQHGQAVAPRRAATPPATAHAPAAAPETRTATPAMPVAAPAPTRESRPATPGMPTATPTASPESPTATPAMPAATPQAPPQSHPATPAAAPAAPQPQRPFAAFPAAAAAPTGDDAGSTNELPVLKNVADERNLSPVSNAPAGPAVSATGSKATPDPNDATSSHWQTITEIEMSGDTSEEITRSEFGMPANLNINDVGVVIFTVDSEFAADAIRAVSKDRSTTLATSLAKVAEAVEKEQAGVLVTDFTTNSALLHKMISTLKQNLPELVTIVVSGNRDTTDMITLINYGQVFRYLLKPIDAQQLCNDINAAAIRHLHLKEHPELVKRHLVSGTTQAGDTSASMKQFVGRIRSLQNGRSGGSS